MQPEQLSTRYDGLSIGLHWLIALLTIILFASGLWMVELDYYDKWYYTVPWWHKGIGFITAMLVVFRFIWQYFRHSPSPILTTARWQSLLAGLVHGVMNLLLVSLLISGYLIVTVKGDPLSVFDWFSIPALSVDETFWSEYAGRLHLWAAWTVIGIACLHLTAALKHHYIDRDITLTRMLPTTKGDNR